MKKQFWSWAILLCVVVSMLAACNAKTGETTLTAPEVTLSGKTVTWNAVEGAESYLVTVNGEEQDVGTALIYTLTITEPGSYDIYVTAVQGKNRKTSLKVTYTVSAELAAPQISLSGNTVQWEVVPGATAYEVFVNDVCKSSVTETCYVVDEEAIGTYLIRVRAKNDTKTGGFSNEVTYTVSEQEGTLERLETPVIALDGKTVRWTPIKNATAYDILLNGVKKATVTECEYRITERVAGEYSVSIVATHNPEYLMSNPSNTLTYTVDDADFSFPILATTESGGVTYVAEICSDGYLRMKPISEITDFKKYMWYLEPDGEFYRIKLWNGQYLACGEQTALDGSEGYQAQRASVGESNLQWKIVNTDSNKYVLYNVNHAERWSSGEWVYSYGYKQSEDVLKFGTDTTGWICSNEDIPYVERTALTAPTLTISGNTVTWAAVENATSYGVYVNNVLVSTQTALTYTLTETREGVYAIYVIAKPATEDFLQSVASNTVEYMLSTLALDQPILAVYTLNSGETVVAEIGSDGFLTYRAYEGITDFTKYTWYFEKIDGTEYYCIKLWNGLYLTRVANGEGAEAKAMAKDNSTAQQWKLIPTGLNQFRLQNVSHIEQWGDSYYYGEWNGVLKFADRINAWEFSNNNIPYVERTALTAPTLTISGNTASWAAVENANAYEVYVNGILTVTQAELTYTITVRNASVYVIAVDTTDNYLDSSPSNTVKQFTMTAPVAIYDTSHNMLLTFDNDGLLVMSTTSKDDAVADYSAFAMQLIASGEYYRIKLANGKYLQHTVIGGTDRFIAAYKADSDAQLFKVTARVDGNFNFYPKDNEGYVICTDNNGSYNQYNDANYGGAIFVLFNVDATIAEDAVNEGTETSVLDRSVVAYYNQNGGAKTLASFDDSGVITVGAEYTTVTDYTEYLWTFEKITEGDYAGKYRIRLADGRYLSYYDNPNSGEVPQACAATKDEADTKQIWILVASGENSYKLENVYLRNYYSDVYLGEWFGSYKFNGGCNAWTFFNP